MSLQSIWTDNWTSSEFDSREIREPDWHSVEAAIRDLDGENKTLVKLIAGNDHELLIGGGGGKYVITGTYGEDEHMSARNDARTGQELELTIGGQTGIYPAELIWGLETALQAAQVFWRTNEFDAMLPWSEP
jgi:hypothetical protein